MARQKELPNTRRPDEPKPQASNDEMDELCEKICKNKRKRVRANQDVVEAIKAALAKMGELGFAEYDYEYDGVKRKLKINSKLMDVKQKVAKRADGDDDEEGSDE